MREERGGARVWMFEETVCNTNSPPCKRGLAVASKRPVRWDGIVKIPT